MHQLARGTRLGRVQSSHVCTACLTAFKRPTPVSRVTLYSALQQPSRNYAREASESTDSATANTAAEISTARSPVDAGKTNDASAPVRRKSSNANVNRPNGIGPSTHTGGRKAMKGSKATSKAALNGAAAHQASQTQLKLWRETLEVLKKLETAQGRLAEQAAIATGVATEESLKTAVASAKEVGKKAALATSGKTTKQGGPALGGTPEEKQAAIEAAKEAQEQVKMLTNALHLLKAVLSTQGSRQPQQMQEGQAQTTEPVSKDDQSEAKLNKHAKKKPPKRTAEKAAPAPVPPITVAPTTPDETVISSKEARDNSALGTDLPFSSIKPAAVSTKKAPLPKKKPKPAGLVPGNKSPYKVNRIESKKLALSPVEENRRPVPRLHYGLDRALFNPGVYHLQDPRSRVFNFDPYLATIMPLQEFDFNALKQYVTSSKDSTLISMAAKHKMKYSGSTSSMTSMLSHFHFLLSGWRPISAAHISRSFTPESMNFTRITRGPAATFLHYRDGTYAIDADKEFDTASILSMLGKSMEKLLTLSKEDFEKYRVTRSHELTDEERNDPESFHYTTFGDFMMRSQLDAYDPRLPGTGMFDLKTRAVVSIRMDAQDFQRGLGYEIRNRFGQWESFEREYFDMIRSAFLKYSLQVRMGRMDGIYVAFHNTQRIFGFQYISINEMDIALHGTDDTALGDREFKLSLHLLNVVLNKATERFPGRSLRIHVEARPSEAAPFMYIFATPVTPGEIAEVQDAGKASVEAFERNILGMTPREADETDDAEVEAKEREEGEEQDDGYDEDSFSADVWETMRQKVEETMENEEQGIESVRDTIEDALEQSGLLRGRSPEETRAYVDALLEAITRTDTEAVAETILKGQEDAETTVEEEALEEADADAEAVHGENTDPGTTGRVIKSDVEAEAIEAESVLEPPAAATEGANAEPLTSDQNTSIVDEDGDSNLEANESSRNDANEVSALQSSPSPSSPSETLSLKDLIIRLAAKVEAVQARDAAASSNAAPEGQAAGKDKEDNSDAGSDSPMSFNYNGDIAELDAPKNKRFERILSAMMASSKESKFSSKATAPPGSETSSPPEDSEPEILGMIMTIRNKVNGRYVVRPDKFNNSDSWTVEYAIQEIEEKRARTLYQMLKKRRKDLLSKDSKDDKDDKDDKDGKGVKDGKGAKGASGIDDRRSGKTAFNREFMKKLYALSARGRRFRKSENIRMRNRPVQVYGVEGGLEFGEVFPDVVDNDNDG